MLKIRLLALLGLCFFSANTLFAQPSNDECANAIVLSDVTNFCSGAGFYTNANATISATVQPGCWPDVGGDVWFSFVAEATTLQVTVVGNTPGPSPGGTLNEPQFAIYSGNCGVLTEVQCASDGFGVNIVETFAGPLQIGETYYIRVDARNSNEGTFELCVNNYNAVPDPSGDCPTGVILCDKSTFNVESLVGTGNLNNEFSSDVCIVTEFASAWYRWTCLDPGTLSFTITPNNPSDDIDFAVFELPGGLDDCDNKVKIRCEAAGESVGSPFQCWEPCTGPTGLREGEPGTDEFPGCGLNPPGSCNPTNNNFVSAIDMVAGRSYALVINNFSNTGSGFSIEWGGTGTFLGPQAGFTAMPTTSACLSDVITFTDNSQSVDGIAEYAWNFGSGATPATATGPGPHDVTYSTPGTKFVTLTVTSEEGCVVTTTEQYTILPEPTVDAEIIADYCGTQDNTGDIFLTPTGDALPYTYDWGATGIFTQDSFLLDQIAGTYVVNVMDANGCTSLVTFDIPEGLSLAAGIDPVNPPTCNGDSDGSISISIEIANPPVTFDFGSGPQASNTLSGIPAGTYNVQVVDGQGCEGFFTIVVEDFPVLELSIDPLDISCFGENDGTITVMPMGGEGSYTYLWSNGETKETIDNLAEGAYTVTVTDGNGCTATASADIIEPNEIFVTLDVQDVLCAGETSGVIDVTASGGTPPFEYSTDGTNFQPDPVLGNLAAGTYTVYVRDSRGCILTLDANIDEPPPLLVNAGPDQTIDLGFTADIRAQTLPLFRPVSIVWAPAETLDCNDCDDPTATPTGTTTYTITITDSTGCTATDDITIFVNIIRPVYPPNAFSPNGDGLNDFFTLYGGPAARSMRTLKVFDRWGELVFEATDIPLNDEPLGWDGSFRGKPMDPAVFAYFADVEFIDGVVVQFEGDLTLVR